MAETAQKQTSKSHAGRAHWKRVSRREILRFSERIVEQFHPERIILFGSYAYGKPNRDSDVDLLVIMPFEGEPAYKSTEISLRLHPRFPTDLLVRTQEQVRTRVALGDCFMRDVLEKGATLYEAANA